MNEKNKFPIPLDLLLLDFIGALMAALGLVELTGPGTLLPEGTATEPMLWGLIVLGGLLMLPMVLHMVAKAKAATNNKPTTVNKTRR